MHLATGNLLPPKETLLYLDNSARKSLWWPGHFTGFLVLSLQQGWTKPTLLRSASLSLEHVCCVFSHVQLFAVPWTVAHKAPLSMRLSRQEYWTGLPFPSPGDLPDWGIQPTAAVSSALAGRLFTTEPPGKPMFSITSPSTITLASLLWSWSQLYFS